MLGRLDDEDALQQGRNHFTGAVSESPLTYHSEPFQVDGDSIFNIQHHLGVLNSRRVYCKPYYTATVSRPSLGVV